ncbi:MAG: transcription antitermination factor NusB [Firmicutes bacterium]|nr:transcription antitermination factor NusB [Bacillota bacterium]
MSRHKARETAFQMLFQLLEGGNDWQMAGRTLKKADLSAASAAFAEELARGAWEKRFEVEQYIKMFAKGWQYDRLFSVDKLVLHTAMYELKYLPSTPAAIVINEAIEIGRAFGTDDSPAFINAVLDNFRIKVLEGNQPEYMPSEEAMAESAAKAEAKANAVVAEAEPVEEVSAPPSMPITEQFASRSFRKIRKDDLTEADIIQPEPEELEEAAPFERDRKPFERNSDRNSERKFERNTDRKFEKKPFDGECKFNGDKKFGDKKFGERKFNDRKPYVKRDDKKGGK